MRLKCERYLLELILKDKAPLRGSFEIFVIILALAEKLPLMLSLAICFLREKWLRCEGV